MTDADRQKAAISCLVKPRGVFAVLAVFLLAATLSQLAATSGLAAGTKGAKIAAHLTKTSFKASKAGSVRVIYRFSKPSKSFGYVLSFAKGSTWQTVKRVTRKGRFRGSHSMSVTKLFARKAMKVGGYRLKLSADGGSTLLAFHVLPAGSAPGAFNKTSPVNGATGQPNTPSLSWAASSNASGYEYCIDTTNNNACDGSWVPTNAATSAGLSALPLGTTYYWQVRAINAKGTTAADRGSWFSFTVSGPKAGRWVATSLTGPVGPVTSIYFTVLPDQATETGFGFVYQYSLCNYGHCECSSSGTGVSAWIITSSPIVGGRFHDPTGVTTVWSGAPGTGTFDGTFDSPTSAHGTAGLKADASCFVISHFISYSIDDGTPFSWTATWQSAS